MKRNKRPRLQSPEKDRSEESEVSSFDSGVDVSNTGLDDSGCYDSLAGKIESLHMINFMCHSNLEVQFNKRITFVTGRNGSGKSTIMAALIVALGGTANVTGRGSGIADFIKSGETWAKVTVTLMNQGINAYKKSVYGDRIVIVRGLSKTSNNTYTCKSASGAVISKKKEEVDKICMALDIQIKNPICILNQDVARSFLSATDSNVRYSMFMKSTHLESLKVIYSDAIDVLKSTCKELESKKMGIAEASKEISQLKEKLEYFASLEKYINEKTSLENEYLWSLVSSEEKDLEVLESEREKLQKMKEEYLESEASFQTVINQLQEDIRETQDNLSNLGKDQGADKIKKKELDAEIQNFQRQIDAANVHLNQLLKKSERQQSDINSIQDHLKQDEEVRSQGQMERLKITEKIKELSGNLSELRDRIETTERDTDNGQETRIQHTMALDRLNADLRDLERLKISLEGQMARADNVGNNMFHKYGPYTSKLRDMIDEAAKRNQFLKKPIGPCGFYVTLTGDSKWARAVEFVVGGLMATYCCDNQKDFDTLNRLMSTVCHGERPLVIVSKFRDARHNLESEKVSAPGYESVLDVLNFTNDTVFNMFVDQARPETILLFETDAQAASLLSQIENVPKNLRMGLTVESDQYYPAPNYRTYRGDNTKPLKYFDGPARSKTVKETLQSDIEKTQLSIKEKNMEIAEVTSKLMKATDFLKKTESNLRLLKQNERKIESEIRQLKNEEGSIAVLPTRVVLEEELGVLQKLEVETQEKIARDKENIEKLTKDKEDRVVELDKMREIENEFQAKVAKLEEKLNESKMNLSRQREKKRDLGRKVADAQSQLDRLAEKIANGKKSLANKLKKVLEVHEERIHTERSPVEIQKLLEKCEKYLKAAEKKMESKDVVINEYKVKHQKFKEMKKTVDVLAKVIETLNKLAKSKKERFTLLQRHTANLVSFHFQACLQTRGYDGHLKFDFKNETLQIEVMPKDGMLRKDTKTLSGGERSYSTVSFILAIWRAVQMPFYFLDEFDVFMDKVNRKVIMDLLLEHANSQNKMQFIFITPQDISSIQSSDSVSVYRMPDPGR